MSRRRSTTLRELKDQSEGNQDGFFFLNTRERITGISSASGRVVTAEIVSVKSSLEDNDTEVVELPDPEERDFLDDIKDCNGMSVIILEMEYDDEVLIHILPVNYKLWESLTEFPERLEQYILPPEENLCQRCEKMFPLQNVQREIVEVVKDNPAGDAPVVEGPSTRYGDKSLGIDFKDDRVTFGGGRGKVAGALGIDIPPEVRQHMPFIKDMFGKVVEYYGNKRRSAK